MSTNGGEAARPDGHQSAAEEEPEEEAEDKVLNLAKEEVAERGAEEEEGNQLGLQAAIQAMQAGQMSLTQLMAAQSPGLWQSQLASAAARLEPPSPPAQVTPPSTRPSPRP